MVTFDVHRPYHSEQRVALLSIPPQTPSGRGGQQKSTRHRCKRVRPSNTVEDDPELYVTDFSDSPSATEFRERIEHARCEAYERYRGHLTAVFDKRGVAEPGALADTVLDALTVWRYIDTGERCRCACHPRLPETDLHDYGFGCICAQSPQDRRRAFDNWRNDIQAFWQSPDGQRIKAADVAAEAELHAWLGTQHGVLFHRHGGCAPELWRGEVDGHSFYFRERHGEWRIELDLQPSGRIARIVDGTDIDGAIRYREEEVDEGDVIASGTTAVQGYGTALVERAQFIVDTIRIHLTRQACTHHRDLTSIEAILGAQVRWCPVCGTRLSLK